jgi:SAM-dependent methyltransferase
VPDPADRLIAYYTAAYDEDARLRDPLGQLELRRTQELLRAALPAPPATVLDVGGGTGAHAAWLAEDGYDVTLVDLVPDHVRRATERAREQPRPFTARLGDARATGAPTAGADACLLLGPLYHLRDATARAAALAEARRVTRSGGLVAAAGISRLAWPLDALCQGDVPVDRLPAMREAIATGLNDPAYGFTDAYLHRPAELAAELEAAGLADVRVHGVEGPGWIRLAPDAAGGHVDALVESAQRVARLCDGEPDLRSASAHLLALGRRP